MRWVLVLGMGCLIILGIGWRIVNNGQGRCQREEINLVNYTEKGKRLPNCFVEFPGEPTREDKNYYIVDDICGQFTKEFMEKMLTREIKTIKAGENSCEYQWGEIGGSVSLILDYTKIDSQKIVQEALKRKIVEEKSIPMRNMVVYQDNGLINTIYLILENNKFMSIERSSKAGLTTENLLNLAKKIALEIKNYK